MGRMLIRRKEKVAAQKEIRRKKRISSVRSELETMGFKEDILSKLDPLSRTKAFTKRKGKKKRKAILFQSGDLEIF